MVRTSSRTWARPRVLALAALLALATATSTDACAAPAPVPGLPAGPPSRVASAAVAAPPPGSSGPAGSTPTTGCRVRTVIGMSVQHRPLVACERGAPGGLALVVVGVIHGDEKLGLGVVDRLMTLPVPYGVDLWLVPTINPDGLAHSTRRNAHGVDENRNFPFHWVASTPGSASYGGPRVLSEPETLAFANLLVRLRPHTVVVFHSPLDAVDYSEGADPAAVRYLAAQAGFPARSLGARPGELTGWYNLHTWDPSAITFEFAATTTPAQQDRVARAVLSLGAWRLTH